MGVVDRWVGSQASEWVINGRVDGQECKWVDRWVDG